MTFRPLDILLDYASSPDSDLRANAAAALGELAEPEAQEKVTELLGDPERRVREAAFHSHLSHPAPSGFFNRLRAARRLRMHSADLVGRRAPGPSAAGIGFAIVFGIVSYLLLTGLASRDLENVFWESLIFSAICVCVAAVFTIVAATAARPIAHYRDMMAGLIMELIWTGAVMLVPAIAMAGMLAVSISGSAEADALRSMRGEEASTAGFLWHFLFMTAAVMACALAARLAAAITARSMPRGGVRAIVSGAAALLCGWFALWLLLLPWHAGASADPEFDVALVGRVGLGAFVALGAYAATLGFVEAAGVRLAAPSRNPWLNWVIASALVLPGLFGLGQLALALPMQQQIVEVESLTTEMRVAIPQKISFTLPLDAEVMLEISPTSLTEEDERDKRLLEKYGLSPISQEIVTEILSGDETLSIFSFSATKQGYDFWDKEYQKGPLNYSEEAIAILEFWERTASTDDELAAEGTEIPSRVWANVPTTPLASVAARIKAETTHRGISTVERKLLRQKDESLRGYLTAGVLDVCVRRNDSRSSCGAKQDFSTLFVALGDRVVEAWPLVGKPRVQAEVRLTMLSDGEDAGFKQAMQAAELLLEASEQEKKPGDTLLVALTEINQNGCYMLPGDVFYRRASGPAKEDEQGQPDDAQEPKAAVRRKSAWIIGTAMAGDADCSAADGIAELPATGQHVMHVDNALKLASALLKPDHVIVRSREQLARQIASAIPALAAETSDSPVRFHLIAAPITATGPAASMDSAIMCTQHDMETLVAGSAVHADKGVFNRMTVFAGMPSGGWRMFLGTEWSDDWPKLPRSSRAVDWKVTPEATQCGTIPMPALEEIDPTVEEAFGPVPSNFDVMDAEDALRGQEDGIDRAFTWSSSKQGHDYWSERNRLVNEGGQLAPGDRIILQYWIKVTEMKRMRERLQSGGRPDFGDDAGYDANNGRCQDPRFIYGSGGLDSHRLHDATDCRAAWERGAVELVE